MRMRDYDGIHTVICQIFVTGKGATTPLLGVHARIQHNPSVSDLKKVAIGSDLSGPVKDGKAGFGHETAGIWGDGVCPRLLLMIQRGNVAGGGFEPPTQGL